MESGGSFRDREDAGRRLAERLAGYRGESPMVFALPRGGVPVGCEIAHALEAPLDIFIARKLGAPGREEFGIGVRSSRTRRACAGSSTRSRRVDCARSLESGRRRALCTRG